MKVTLENNQYVAHITYAGSSVVVDKVLASSTMNPGNVLSLQTPQQLTSDNSITAKMTYAGGNYALVCYATGKEPQYNTC